MGVKAVWLPSSQSEDAKAASKRWQCACARRPPAWPPSQGTGSGSQAGSRNGGTWARGQPAQAHRGRAMLFNSWRIRNHLITRSFSEMTYLKKIGDSECVMTFEMCL